MKRIILSLVAAAAALALPSCLQNETTIHLKKDGSGIIVEETVFGAQMMAMLGQMAAFGAPGDDPLADLVSEEKATERASQFGEGVTFVKAEKIERNGGQGARITYAFKDISSVRIAAGDAAKAAMPDLGGAALAAAEEADPITFAYADDKLTINLPQPKPAEGEAAGGENIPLSEEEANPEMEAMIKQMLGDMKIALRVLVEPGIAATNATHRDGNTITLMEMDMGKLIEQEGALRKLGTLDQANPQAALEAIKTIDGVKMETETTVTVTVE